VVKRQVLLLRGKHASQQTKPTAIWHIQHRSRYRAIPAAGNIYGAVPVDGWRNASIILMIIHQCVAYALYVTPVFFMWEKLVHTHDKPLWIRLPSRLPVGQLSLWKLRHGPVAIA